MGGTVRNGSQATKQPSATSRVLAQLADPRSHGARCSRRLSDVTNNWQLNNCYNLRTERLHCFKSEHHQFTVADRACNVHRIHTSYIAQYASDVLVATLMVLGGWMGFNGVITPGAFSALLSVSRRVGQEVLSIGDRRRRVASAAS